MFHNGILHFLSSKVKIHLLYFSIPSVFSEDSHFFTYTTLVCIYLLLGTYLNMVQAFSIGTMPFIPFVSPRKPRITLIMKVIL